MRAALHFPDDFHLAIECLEGRSSALAHLQEMHREALLAYLQRAGAQPREAREIVDELWSDCVAPPPGATPKLARYTGTCALRTFLNTVTLNALFTRRRRERRWSKVLVPDIGDAISASVPAPAGGGAQDHEATEAPLLDIMREAIHAAFMACPAEDFVLLQLAHTDGLHLTELAKMFGRTKSTVHRDVERAEEEIAEATLQYIKATDPWLELKWSDFLDLCSTASPACFGVE